MELYDKLDNAVMKGVNAGVRAWNWTTGRTKTDLANNFLSIAPIGDFIGCLKYPLALSLFVPGSFFVSHFFQTLNKKCEDKEENALRNSTLDTWAENYKNNTMRWQGYFNGFISSQEAVLSYLALNSENGSPLVGLGLGIGSGFRSASCFVIRADSLPPRKNCLSRGLDNLKKWYSEHQAEPSGVPQPAFKTYFNLEDQLR